MIAAASNGIHHAARVEPMAARSEEHTSELQSLRHLVCRLLLEKKKKDNNILLHTHQDSVVITAQQHDAVEPKIHDYTDTEIRPRRTLTHLYRDTTSHGSEPTQT